MHGINVYGVYSRHNGGGHMYEYIIYKYVYSGVRQSEFGGGRKAVTTAQ
jgi:hypothetical protein